MQPLFFYILEHLLKKCYLCNHAKFIPIFIQNGTYFFIPCPDGSVYLLHLQVQQLQTMVVKFCKQRGYISPPKITDKIHGLVSFARGKRTIIGTK